MPINIENVKTLLRSKINTLFPQTTLITEGNTVKTTADKWIVEKYHSIKTVFAAENLQLLSGIASFTFYGKNASVLAADVNTAAAQFDPLSTPAANALLAVFSDKVTCSGLKRDGCCYESGVEIHFTACLK